MGFSNKLLFNNIIGRFGLFSKPNFIIVGAQKAGTTALFEILNQHSKITSSISKEINYFDNDKLFRKKNLSNYHKYFPLSFQVPEGNILFEATPEYLYHPNVAQRIYQYNPRIKIIIVLRNPIERAISAWTMYHHHLTIGPNKHLHDSRPFDLAIKKEIDNIKNINFYSDVRGYVKRGIYYDQIKQYLNHFPIQNILFIESRELKKEFNTTLNKTLDFLNLNHEKIENKIVHQSKVKPLPFDKEKDLLKEFYAPYNEQLFALIDKKYDW